MIQNPVRRSAYALEIALKSADWQAEGYYTIKADLSNTNKSASSYKIVGAGQSSSSTFITTGGYYLRYKPHQITDVELKLTEEMITKASSSLYKKKLMCNRCRRNHINGYEKHFKICIWHEILRGTRNVFNVDLQLNWQASYSNRHVQLLEDLATRSLMYSDLKKELTTG